MIRKALRRANAFTFFILLGLLFTAGYIGSTYAYFDGEVDQTATFAGGYLIAPSALGTPVALGYGAALGWTPATGATPVFTLPTTTLSTVLANAQALYGLDRGSNSSACPAFTDTTATYTVLTTNVTSTLATTTNGGSSSYDGHYYCYEIQSTHGSWFQGAVFAGVQVGLFPTSVTLGGTVNSIMANADKITIVYNQTVTVVSGSIAVAACPSVTGTTTLSGPPRTNTLYGGGTAVIGGSCGGSGSVGVIQSLTLTSATKTFASSSIAGSGTKTITITLGGGSNVTVTSGSSGSFVPGGTNIQSSVGSATVCNCTTVSDSGGF
jgi:hypothetical protein